MADRLRLVICTPRDVVLDERVESARVPTETGQVGLRPREEPLLLAIEPGLIIFRVEGAVQFAATAGGLFEGDRTCATLHTPFAVTGEGAHEVIDALDRALATPDSEIAARRRFGELEERIIEELRHRPPRAPVKEGHV